MRVLLTAINIASIALALNAQVLETRYINAGWGSRDLVIDPVGTTVLMEAGDTGMGTTRGVIYSPSASRTSFRNVAGPRFTFEDGNQKWDESPCCH